MSTHNFGALCHKMRARLGWQQDYVLHRLKDYKPVINRIERGMVLPKPKARRKMLEVLKIPIGEEVIMHFDKQPSHVYLMRDELMQMTEYGLLDRAKELVRDFSLLPGFEGGKNLHFLLSQKAKLLEQLNHPPDEVFPLVRQGLELTGCKYNNPGPNQDILIFEELDLLHTLAKLYAKSGNRKQAIKILSDVLAGMQSMPNLAREKERRVVPVIISLISNHIEEGNYAQALDLCELGVHTSAMWCGGEGIPDVLLHKAYALQETGQNHGCRNVLTSCLAGFLLAGEKNKAAKVMQAAREDFKIQLDTQGMEELDIPERRRRAYARGSIPKTDSVGRMISIWRDEIGLATTKLSEGICSASNLSRIENGGIRGSVYQIEPLFQRLGRDPELYCNFFLKMDDFEAKELQGTILMHIIHGKHADASDLLQKLKRHRAYGSKTNLQFVLMAEADIYAATEDSDSDEVVRKNLEALRITRPKYNEEEIADYALTHTESILISTLASEYGKNDQLKRASKMYEALAKNLERRYVDEREKSRMYASVLHCQSSYLAKLGRRTEAMEVIAVAEEFERNTSGLSILPLLAGNKAYNLHAFGKKDESLKYFALAYHGFSMFEAYGKKQHMEITRNAVAQKFDIKLH